MSIYVNNKFRIKRSATFEELMVKISSGNKILGSYRDILMLSAVIGYRNNRYIPIEKTAKDGVLMQFFNEIDYDMIDLIAYAHKKEQSILKSDDKYDIFSSYANGGFTILVNELGLDLNNDIDEDTQENILNKLYSILLTSKFDTSSKIHDLFI